MDSGADGTRGRVEVLSERTVLDDFFKIDEVRLRYEHFSGAMSEPIRRMRLDRGQSVAAVVVRLPERDVLLVEQFKYPTYGPGTGWVVEVPAGMVEPGESEETALRRELREEIGYDVTTLQPIGRYFLSPGGSTEQIALYYAEVEAQGRVDAGGGVRAEDEDIRLRVIPAADLDTVIESGRVDDAKTLLGLMWLRHKWMERR